MKQAHDLTQGDEAKQLIRMSLPMMLGIFAILFVNLADTWFVGQLGTDQLAAMGFTFPVLMIMTGLAFGVGAGASSVIARAIGANEWALVRSYSTQAIVIAVGIAVLFAIIGMLTIEPFFRLLGAPEAVMVYIREYMHIWYLGCFLVVVPMVGNACIRASGDTRLPSVVMMTVAVVNLILDPLLIFGLWGFPALGVQGAALATIIAYAMAFLVSLDVLIRRLKFLSWEGCTQRVMQSWKSILKIGVPAAGTNLINPLSAAIVTALVAAYGSDAVAGFGVASRIEMFAVLPIMALSTIMGPFAGQNWGAGKLDRLNRALRLSMNFSWAWGMFIALILWLFGHWIVVMFTDDPDAYESARLYMNIVPITFALYGIVMTVNSVAQGIGDAIPALMFSLARLIAIYLPVAWLLSHYFGLDGIYWAAAIANALVGFAAILWVKRRCARATLATHQEAT